MKREKILVRTVDSDDVVILMGFLCNFYSTVKLSKCQLYRTVEDLLTSMTASNMSRRKNSSNTIISCI